MIEKNKQKKAFYLLIIGFLLFVYLFVFLTILYTDTDIKNFFKLINNKTILPTADQNLLFGFNKLPFTDNIYIFTFISVAFYGLAMCFNIGLLFIKNKHYINKHYKRNISCISIITAILIVVSLIFFGLAQYQFSIFDLWINSLGSKDHITSIVNSLFHNHNLESKNDLINALFNISKNNSGTPSPSYNWVGIHWVWCIIGIQILIQLLLLLIFNSIMIQENDQNFVIKTYHEKTKKIRFNLKIFQIFINRFSDRTIGSISFFIITISIILFIPEIIYLILLNQNSYTETIIKNSFVTPYLFGPHLNDTNYMNIFLGRKNYLILIIQLPMIMIFVWFTFILGLIYISVHKILIDKKTFFSYLIIFSVIEFGTLIVFAISMIWYNQNITFLKNNSSVISKYYADVNSVKYYWFNSYRLIGLFSITTIISIFKYILVYFRVYNLYNLKNDELNIEKINK